MKEICVYVNPIWYSDWAKDSTTIGGSEFDYQREQEIILVFKASRWTLSPTQLPTQQVLGDEGCYGLGRPAREPNYHLIYEGSPESVPFEHLENRSRSLDVTWQPVRGGLTGPSVSGRCPVELVMRQ